MGHDPLETGYRQPSSCLLFFGSLCTLASCFLWAVVATISAQQTLRAHSTMLQNLIILASKYVKKSFEKAPPVPETRNINLEELLKSLQ